MAKKLKQAPIPRRDGSGHLDPKYAAELRTRSQENAPADQDDAGFLREPHSRDGLAEQLGSTFVQTATSGEDCAEDVSDEIVTEEEGGPFVESTGTEEFAHDTDASNPPDAHREPFPRT